MPRKEKKTTPFWIQVALILLAGVLLSLGIWMYSNSLHNDSEQEHESKSFKVTFAAGDGAVIAEKNAEREKGVLPPEIEIGEGTVFRGWDNRINCIRADIETHPILYPIKESNLFYFNSEYVFEGEDFELELLLGGNVNISSGELNIEYDPEVLTFIDADESECCRAKLTENGTITVTLNSESVLTDSTSLAVLKFHAEEKDAYSTRIDLIGGAFTVREAGKETPIDSATINNNIYFLKEVG